MFSPYIRIGFNVLLYSSPFMPFTQGTLLCWIGHMTFPYLVSLESVSFYIFISLIVYFNFWLRKKTNASVGNNRHLCSVIKDAWRVCNWHSLKLIPLSMSRFKQSVTFTLSRQHFSKMLVSYMCTNLPFRCKFWKIAPSWNVQQTKKTALKTSFCLNKYMYLSLYHTLT